MSIDFGFLRECVAALRAAPPEAPFSMKDFMQPYPHAKNNWCGTPMCVIGHWAFQKACAEIPMPSREQYRRMDDLTFNAVHSVGSTKDGRSKYGLTQGEVKELFGGFGCGNARTKQQAIEYIENFIVMNGGSLEDPKPLDVTVAPDWEQIAAKRTVLPSVISEEVTS